MPSASDSSNAQAPEHASASSKEIPDEQEEVDSSFQQPIHECFLVKVNRALHEKMGVIKEFLTILILLAILIGFLYNHFSKDDRDLPDSFCTIYINCYAPRQEFQFLWRQGMIQIGNRKQFFKT